MEIDVARLSRLVSIITFLQTKRIITAVELAEKFSVSTRTIYRDIKTLRQSNVPVLSEDGKGYSMMDGYRLLPFMFTEKEALALVTAETLILKSGDSSLIREYQQSIRKIKAVLRKENLDAVSLLSGRMKSYRSFLAEDLEHLTLLQTAILECNEVEIDYHSSVSKRTLRKAEPFALLMSTEGHWILVAYCKLRKAYRMFRLDRIKTIQLTGKQFPHHDISLQEYFEKYC